MSMFDVDHRLRALDAALECLRETGGNFLERRTAVVLLKDKAPDAGGAEGFREALFDKEKVAVPRTEDKTLLPVEDIDQTASVAEPVYVGRFVISPERWYEIPDNVRQRDTEAHAAVALRNHLSKPHPAHRIVVAARLPGGAFMKVEGHTRAFLWQRGHLQAPDKVLMDVYDVQSCEAAGDLYDAFDNPKTGKTARDRMFGAQRELGVELRTPNLRAGGYRDASMIAFKLLNGWAARPAPKEVVSYFTTELMALDRIHPTKAAFIGVTTTAALITLRRNPVQAFDFWTEVQADRGKKSNNQVDGVQAIHDLIATVRQRKDQAGRRQFYINSACTAFEKWRAGKLIQTLRPMQDAVWKTYLAETAARRR